MKKRINISWLGGRVSRNIIFWLIFTLWHFMNRGNIREWFVPMFIFIFIFYGIPAYVNNLWLIPTLLLRRKYWQYFLGFAVLLLLTSIMAQYITREFNAMYPGMNFMGKEKASLLQHAITIIWVFLPVSFGMLISDGIQNRLKLEDLQRQRLESELAALRSQINPHFLFNALNTIYGMSRRNDTGTPDAVLKLSDILRHNLYECNEPEITMAKEIYMLQQYIELSKLRLHDKSSIRFEMDADIKEQKIAPLLLLPFIENAIKHGLGSEAYNAWIDIKLVLKGRELLFTCINSHKKNTGVTTYNDSQGIGLNNVKRRLELLYPGRHDLDITNTEDRYTVTLKINLI